VAFVPKRQGRLFRKYVVIFAALFSGALLTSGLVQLYFSYQENQTAVVSLERGQAVAAASTIEQFIRETERQIGWVTAPPSPTAAVSTEQRRGDYRKLLDQAPAVSEVSYLDAAGDEQLRVARSPSEGAASQADRAVETAFREARSGKTYFGPVYFRDRSKPYMTIARGDSGENAGVTLAEVALQSIWDVVSQIKVGQTGHAYVVDAAGQLIAHPDTGLVLQKTDLSSSLEVQAARAGPLQERQRRGDSEAVDPLGPSVMVVSQFEGQRFASDPGRFSERLVTYEAIDPPGWVLFVEQPLEEAFAPVRAAIVRTVLLLLMGLLVAVLASLYFVRRMVTPIQALQAGAARIGAGALDQRIEVRTGDELEALVDEFNAMASQLQESYTNLERKVEERTRDLAEALKQLKALGEVGQVVSSSLDLQRVLSTVVSHADLLSGTDGGAIYEFDEPTEEFHLRATRQFDAQIIEVLQATPFRLGEGAVGRAAVVRQPLQIPDILVEGAYEGRPREAMARAGYRAVLAVPLLREDRIVGGLVVARKSPGEFPPPVVELVKTFASQSSLAIQNARLFREVEEKRLQLEEISQHKSEFLANMSHELRTPLNAIIGFSEVLVERMFGELNEKQEEYLRDILDSGKHLLSLINDILDLSKVEAGRMELELGTFSLREALENGLTMLRERASRHGIGLGLEVDPAVDLIEADERKVKQVIFNLLSNAVKFTRDGGRVEVTARRVDGEVQMAVQDTGIGIAPEDQEHIFEEFRQVGQGAARTEGTGLGLALAKRLIDLHGGRIGVESEPGVGSTFTFTLPMRRRDTAESAAIPRTEVTQ